MKSAVMAGLPGEPSLPVGVTRSSIRAPSRRCSGGGVAPDEIEQGLRDVLGPFFEKGGVVAPSGDVLFLTGAFSRGDQQAVEGFRRDHPGQRGGFLVRLTTTRQGRGIRGRGSGTKRTLPRPVHSVAGNNGVTRRGERSMGSDKIGRWRPSRTRRSAAPKRAGHPRSGRECPRGQTTAGKKQSHTGRC